MSSAGRSLTGHNAERGQNGFPESFSQIYWGKIPVCLCTESSMLHAGCSRVVVCECLIAVASLVVEHGL